MIALLKIEWIKMIRTWMTFVLFIGLPVFFFLLFSGMEFSSNNQEQQSYITSYMLTMTAFSMSSLLCFVLSILLVFSCGVIFCDVMMPINCWLGSAALLLLSSLLFLAFGLLISQLKSQQLMTLVGNIAFLGLAILGGS